MFEFTALVVSRLSDTANLRTAEANAQRPFEPPAAALFDEPANRLYSSGSGFSGLEERTRQARARDQTVFEPETSRWYCVLHVDARPIGGLALSCGSPSGQCISPMLAEALASLSAVAMERYRSIERALRAEAIRQCEQLRGAVLDTLGHELKTPATTIWAASPGLLEPGGLSAMQAEIAHAGGRAVAEVERPGIAPIADGEAG